MLKNSLQYIIPRLWHSRDLKNAKKFATYLIHHKVHISYMYSMFCENRMCLCSNGAVFVQEGVLFLTGLHMEVGQTNGAFKYIGSNTWNHMATSYA